MKQYKVEITKDNKGKWRWHLKARNGKIIEASSQGFTRRHTAKRSFERFLDRNLETIVPPFNLQTNMKELTSKSPRTRSTSSSSTSSSTSTSTVLVPRKHVIEKPWWKVW